MLKYSPLRVKKYWVIQFPSTPSCIARWLKCSFLAFCQITKIAKILTFRCHFFILLHEDWMKSEISFINLFSKITLLFPPYVSAHGLHQWKWYMYWRYNKQWCCDVITAPKWRYSHGVVGMSCNAQNISIYTRKIQLCSWNIKRTQYLQYRISGIFRVGIFWRKWRYEGVLNFHWVLFSLFQGLSMKTYSRV